MRTTRRKMTWLAGLAVGIMVLTTPLVRALPTPSQFELEGNAIVDGTGDDWQNTVPLSASSEALISTFLADGSGNATIFTGGGSKDLQDISSWKWKDQLGGLPDKDNITNAYAAGYQSPTGELIIYFGADRFATAGDAQLGFWFFHQQVRAVGEAFVSGDGTPGINHSIGDILVLANFSNGGSSVQVQVYRWIGGTNPLQLIVSDNNARCGTNTNPNVCAITNAGSTPAPWTYVPKSGTAGTFPEVSFFEGGINLTALTGQSGAGCFSAFMAETRSSTSVTATLKDFALGEFNTCNLDISKACPGVVYNPTTGLLEYTSEITVTNSGFGPLFDITVSDTPSAPAPAQQFTLGSLAPGASHTFVHTFTYAPGPTSPNPPSNDATATAAVAPGGDQIVDGGSAHATCPQVQFDANLTVSKACTTRVVVDDNRVVVRVDVSGTVCNVAPGPGIVPAPIDGIILTDTPPIDPINFGSLLPGECRPYTASYFPNTVTGSGLPHDQTFEDTILASGVNRFNGATHQQTATANCPLCPPE